MKIFIVILALASAIFARNFINPGKFSVAVPMSGNSTALALSTIPVLHEGEMDLSVCRSHRISVQER